jgi:hypothetical protein
MDPSVNEAEISSIVEAGGGKYIGVLKGVPEKTEMIVLFISRETKSTLGIPISRLTVEVVREELAESNAAFGARSTPEKVKFEGTSGLRAPAPCCACLIQTKNPNRYR